MDVRAALLASKENGRSYSRARVLHGTRGWIRWDPEKGESFMYRLTYEDLVAEDWELSSETIERITKGRWVVAP